MRRLLRPLLFLAALSLIGLVITAAMLGSASNTKGGEAWAQKEACTADHDGDGICDPDDPDLQCFDGNGNGVCDTEEDNYIPVEDGCEDIDGDNYCDDAPAPAPDPVSGCQDQDGNNVCDDVQLRPIDIEDEFCGNGTHAETVNGDAVCVPDDEADATPTVDTNGDGVADATPFEPQTTEGAAQPANNDGTCPEGTQRRVTSTGNECVTAPTATGPTGTGGTGSPTGTSPTGTGGSTPAGGSVGGGGGVAPAGGGAGGGGAPVAAGGATGGAAPKAGGTAPGAGASTKSGLPATAGIFDSPRGAALVAAFQDIAGALEQGAGALDKIMPEQVSDRQPDTATGWGLLLGAFGLIVGGLTLIGRKVRRGKGRHAKGAV